MGVQTGVPYCATEALSWMPEMASPAPAVLNSIPVTSIARMARRDFMDWFPSVRDSPRGGELAA